ncbi:MAG: hypothetical protein JXQ73_33200 [Phycisphaerae bacterium]|nr:hypothetical protein [Phycisphaerae bacterium]
MIRAVHRAARLAAVFGFVAACTGADRALHLLACHASHAPAASCTGVGSKDPAPRHHSDDCPICLLLTIGSRAVLTPPPCPIVVLALRAYPGPAPSEAPVPRKDHDPFGPRAPPSPISVN